MSEDFRHLGSDFETPDAVAKVTGRAKYADDFIFDDMLHAKTLKSPYAHALVRSIDTSPAEGLEGVEGVITFEDVGGTYEEGQTGFHPLDEEPKYYGAPIAAVAAVDEYTAAEAVEAIEVEYDVMEHVIDPLESLKPGGPNAHQDGNVIIDGEVAEIKWEDADFGAEFPENPGEWNFGWEYGDVEEGFDAADVILEDIQYAHSVVQNPMEPRSTVARWENNGDLTVWASTQSGTFNLFGFLFPFGLDHDQFNLIGHYCGGGFGSKAVWYPQQYVPIHLAQQTGRPVKIRGTRKEEFFWGNGRTAVRYRFRIGLTNEPRLTAVDMEMISTSGAVDSTEFNAMNVSAQTITAMFNPDHFRANGIGVFTNTPKTWPHRGPGENQAALALGATFGKAADELGMDPVDFHAGIAADHHDPVGANRAPNTSCYLGEAVELSAEMIDYDEIRGLNGQIEDGKLYGVGVGVADHTAGGVGFDGMLVIRPDNKVEVRTGIGNLGTYSYVAVARAAAETLQVPWDMIEVLWGETNREPNSVIQAGSNTVFSESFSQHRAAQTAVAYLQEIAAGELGGEPDDYVVQDGEVYHGDDETQSLTFGEAASIGLELGGKFTGEEIPDEDAYSPTTLNAVSGAIGEGIVALGRTTGDDLDGHSVHTYCACVAVVSIDLDTGVVRVEDFRGATDCGNVIHPRSVKAQVEGGFIQGMGYALTEHKSFDEQTGIPYNTDWYTNKTPTILDYGYTEGDAVDEPDFFGAHGTKGLGEPPYGAGAGAVANAVYNALGTDIQPPIFASKVLDALANGETEVM